MTTPLLPLEPLPGPVPAEVEPLPEPEPLPELAAPPEEDSGGSGLACPSVIRDGDAEFMCELLAGHVQRHKGGGVEWEDLPDPTFIATH